MEIRKVYQHNNFIQKDNNKDKVKQNKIQYLCKTRSVYYDVTANWVVWID